MSKSEAGVRTRWRPVARPWLWAWPLAASLALLALGLVLRQTVEDSVRAQTAGELRALLDADETAVRIWLQATRADAESLAVDRSVTFAVQGLDRISTGRPDLAATLANSGALSELRDDLMPKLKALGYYNFLVVDRGGRVLAEGEDIRLGRVLAGYPREFLAKVIAHGPSVSLPFADEGVDLHSSRDDAPAMLTAAPVLDDGGRPIAALALTLRPEQSFSTIMHVARFGRTGETYAFDRHGLLITESRFDDDLKKLGLLPDRPEARSTLTIELRAPGADLSRGGRLGPDQSSRPLTTAVAAAIAGGRGVDVTGYRDYRGAPSIGAWTWLPEYDFGMVTEMDTAEAYGPFRPIRLAYWALLALLTLASAAIFAFTIVVERQARAIRAAALEARRLGQYTLEEKIGSGGMGSVYRARHAFLRRPTAVKLLDLERVSSNGIARFEREAQATGLLTHPNTIILYDYGHTPEGLFYYAMEYLEGINLSQLVDRHGPQPEARVVSILTQACGSLAEAHDAGLIHRDIKPANLFLTCRGGIFDFVKVLDFGLVKSTGVAGELDVTGPNHMPGTPAYLSPEAIARIDRIDHRADLYALGAVGYFLLTGTPVFTGYSAVELFMKHARVEPDRPSSRLGRTVSPKLESLLLRCLSKRPEDRPADARELGEALASCEVEAPWTQAEAAAWWRANQAPSPRGTPLPPIATGDTTLVINADAATIE